MATARGVASCPESGGGECEPLQAQSVKAMGMENARNIVGDANRAARKGPKGAGRELLTSRRA